MVTRFELKNRRLRLVYNADSGEFQLSNRSTGTAILSGVYSGISLENGTDWRSRGDSYIDSEEIGSRLRIFHQWSGIGNVIQEFTLEPDAEHFLLKVSVVNESGAELRLNTIKIFSLGEDGALTLGPDPLRYHVYTNPYYKTPASVRDVFDGFDSRIYMEGQTQGVRYLDREYVTPWASTFDGVLYDPVGRQSAVFGFTSCERFLPQIEMRYDQASHGSGIGTFTMMNRCEGRVCGVGETVESETAYFYTGFSAEKGQEIFAKLTGQTMQAIRLDRPMSGWCSWHYAFFRVTEDDVERNLEFAANHPEVFAPEPGGFEYVLIDYGWQKSIGSPEVNSVQFPRGMKRLADMIRERGFKPGIWIAPFWIEADADIVSSHPEYLLQDANGELLKGPPTFQHPASYRLDVSHPGARQYVLDQLNQLVNEWGYDLIKMDFMEIATVHLMEERSGIRYYDNNLTSIEHLRSMCAEMQRFADSSDRDVWLSPCGSPTLALCGIFKSNFVAEDAIIRFLPDKINMHGGVKVFAETLALRKYLQNHIWTNNYESVILRSPRPYPEARINVTSAGLSGGILFIGDDLSLLEPDRLQLYAKMLPIYPVQARALDLYDSHFAETWLLKVETGFETWWVAGLFNWGEEERDIRLSFPEDGPDPDVHYRLYDFWDQQDLGTARGGITVPKISPEDCKVLAIRACRPHPWLLSTDYHLTQGGVEIGDLQWNADSLTLFGRFAGRRHGSALLTFAVPAAYVFDRMECRNAETAISAPSLIKLELHELNGTDREFRLVFRSAE